tara:strand:+ start:247 stop:516 length:270 start_codon:yes stop_codon:yes gene_type:complete
MFLVFAIGLTKLFTMIWYGRCTCIRAGEPLQEQLVEQHPLMNMGAYSMILSAASQYTFDLRGVYECPLLPLYVLTGLISTISRYIYVSI